MTAIELIAAERKRQPSFDDRSQPLNIIEFTNNELALAAACYTVPDSRRSWISGAFSKGNVDVVKRLWPWSYLWWKPTPDDRERELVKAAAMIVAEIDRLRAERGEGK
jgi:hypothetical protein